MGYEPVVLDNLVTGNRFAVRFGPFYEAPIEDAAAVKSIVHAHGIGQAILLAGHVYVGESASNAAGADPDGELGECHTISKVPFPIFLILIP
jgi:UDP-glucose 4-epimerase